MPGGVIHSDRNQPLYRGVSTCSVCPPPILVPLHPPGNGPSGSTYSGCLGNMQIACKAGQREGVWERDLGGHAFRYHVRLTFKRHSCQGLDGSPTGITRFIPGISERKQHAISPFLLPPHPDPTGNTPTGRNERARLWLQTA